MLNYELISTNKSLVTDTDSGYFVPKSLDKKGIHEFLFDRAKRLLTPFVVYTFFLGPFVEYGKFVC